MHESLDNLKARFRVRLFSLGLRKDFLHTLDQFSSRERF